MTLTRTPPIVIGWAAVAAEAERLRYAGMSGIEAWEMAAGVAPDVSEHIRVASRAKITARTRIVALLADGVARTAREIALVLSDLDQHRVAQLCRDLVEAGTHAVSGWDGRTGGQRAKMYRVCR